MLTLPNLSALKLQRPTVTTDAETPRKRPINYADRDNSEADDSEAEADPVLAAEREAERKAQHLAAALQPMPVALPPAAPANNGNDSPPGLTIAENQQYLKDHEMGAYRTAKSNRNLMKKLGDELAKLPDEIKMSSKFHDFKMVAVQLNQESLDGVESARQITAKLGKARKDQGAERKYRGEIVIKHKREMDEAKTSVKRAKLAGIKAVEDSLMELKRKMA